MLTFTTLSLPPISLAMSSSDGPIMRHGPHHSAQKSTSTGVSDFSTSCEAGVVGRDVGCHQPCGSLRRRTRTASSNETHSCTHERGARISAELARQLNGRVVYRIVGYSTRRR